jgi:plastocyanin
MTLSLRLISCSAALLFTVACSSNDSTPTVDATAATVQTVDCTTVTPAMSITTSGLAYSPAAATIAVNGVIKWTLPSTHNVESTTAGFAVDYGATKCLKFTAAGQYTYKCTAHGFTGSVTVQ